MAKTKASAKAAAERLKEMTSPKPTEPPPKRARTKSTQGKVSETTPPPAEIDFDITWANFSKIKAFHKLTDKETQDVLLKVVGPDPTGTTFWTDYQRRVKQELAVETMGKTSGAPPVEPVLEPTMEPPVEPAEPPASTGKRRRLKYLDFTAPPPDPTLSADPEPEDSDYDECEEEEMFQTDGEDPIDPCEDELPAVCGPRGDDDQDSPSGGAAAVATHETPKVVVSPPDPVEPVCVPVPPKDDPAASAKADLEAKLSTRPTAVRSGRSVQHNVQREWDKLDDDSPPALHSMLFLTLILHMFFLFGSSCVA